MVVALLIIIVLLLSAMCTIAVMYLRKSAHDINIMKNDLWQIAENLVDKDL